MAVWLDMKRFHSVARLHECFKDIPTQSQWPRFDLSQPLVLYRIDLHMLHILVDRDDALWSLDKPCDNICPGDDF